MDILNTYYNIKSSKGRFVFKKFISFLSEHKALDRFIETFNKNARPLDIYALDFTLLPSPVILRHHTTIESYLEHFPYEYSHLIINRAFIWATASYAYWVDLDKKWCSFITDFN